MTLARFCPVSLSDPRCAALWRHSDAEALAEVARRYPQVLPAHEWELVRSHQDFIYGGPTAYREFSKRTEGRDFTDDYLAEEFDLLTQNPRWAAVIDGFFNSAVARYGTAMRFLDLGSWTGGHAAWVARELPEATVYAREIVAACEYAVQRTSALFAGGRVIVEMGDHLMPTLPQGMNFVFAGEVMEHVPDVKEFVGAVEGAASDGGLVCFTTPIQQPDDHLTRVHTRNVETEDILDRFGGKRDLRVMNVAGAWHVFGWTVDGAPTLDVDWGRKLAKWGF